MDSSRLARDGASARNVPPTTPDAATLSSILLVNIPATRTSVSVLSLLPDMTVPVPQREPVTLRQALSSGGVASVVGGVQDLVGTRIQHVAAIEGAALGVMTDAVGGVDLVASSESRPGNAVDPMPGGRLSGSGVSSLQLKLGNMDEDVQFGTLQAAGPTGSAAAVPDATALAAVQQALDGDSLADYLARVTPTD